MRWGEKELIAVGILLQRYMGGEKRDKWSITTVCGMARHFWPLVKIDKEVC